MTPKPLSAALLREGSGPRESLAERIRDTPIGSRGGRGLSVRHASSWVATPPRVIPWRFWWPRPTGFPAFRPRWEWYLVHSAACWSWATLQQSQVPVLQRETARGEEAVPQSA